MRRRKIAGAALSLLALSTACGSGAAATGAQDDPAEVAAAPSPQRDDDCPIVAGVGPQLTAIDNWFGPDCLTVRSDATLHLQNLGRYEHSFTISEESFGTKPFRIDVNLPGGDPDPKTVELKGVLEVGSYDYFCTFHGGMDGVIEVIDPI